MPSTRFTFSLRSLAATLALASIAPFACADTMQAIVYDKPGPASVLHLAEVERPVPGVGQVLVKVRAAGVNPIDWKIRSRSMGGKIPAIPGFDISGDIVALGSGVKDYKVGDAVFGNMGSLGGYAQYAVIPVMRMARKPVNIDYLQAAAVPVPAITAYQALFTAGGLKSGQTVLIHGAGGGVGHFAVQLAKHAGATVIGTGSASNEELIKRMGADVFVDYRTQKFEDAAKDIDLVLDSIGGETLQRSYGVLKKGGNIVSIVGNPDPKELNKRGIRGSSLNVNDTDEIRKLAQLLQSGALKVEIGQVFALKDAAKAQESSETTHVHGRIVLDVDNATK
jgi:NADPH:quinone reductase-like Zn-dependent oxidoreductase